MRPLIRKMPGCSYCGNSAHNIGNCRVDNELGTMLDLPLCPKFFDMSHKILKKIAACCGLKTSLSKLQLACRLSQEHRRRHVVVEGVSSNFEETSCPICLDEFEKTGLRARNTTITKCGHKFCTSCIILHARRNDDCPCCRTSMSAPIHKEVPDPTYIGWDEDILGRVTEENEQYAQLSGRSPSILDENWDRLMYALNHVDTTDTSHPRPNEPVDNEPRILQNTIVLTPGRMIVTPDARHAAAVAPMAPARIRRPIRLDMDDEEEEAAAAATEEANRAMDLRMEASRQFVTMRRVT